MKRKCSGITALDPGSVEAAYPSYDVTQSGSFSFRNYRVTKAAVETDTGRVEQMVDISSLDMDHARLLGNGASGRVLAVEHKPTGQLVAVKKIPITEKRQRDEIHKELLMLRKEAEDNFTPYIIRIYGAFFDSKGYMLIPMERMDGSLADAVKLYGKDKVSEDILRAIGKQALLGFVYLHKHRNVIHRDIKPQNLLLNREGFVKISDFGVAKEHAGTAQGASTFVGTQYYMSPERLNGAAHSFPADIWSLGLTLVYCAVGGNPWFALGITDKSTFFDLLALINAGKTPSLPSNMSRDAAAFVDSCLKGEPTERPQASQLLEDPWMTGCSEEQCRKVVSRWVEELMERTGKEESATPPKGDKTLPFSPSESPALQPLPGFHDRKVDDDIFSKLDDAISGAL